VSGIEDSRDSEAEEANNKLNEGLKSCRAMVSNYRALLDKKPIKPAADEAEPGDTPDDDAEAPPA
jgi:hypothetical protein